MRSIYTYTDITSVCAFGERDSTGSRFTGGLYTYIGIYQPVPAYLHSSLPDTRSNACIAAESEKKREHRNASYIGGQNKSTKKYLVPRAYVILDRLLLYAKYNNLQFNAEGALFIVPLF